MTRGPRKVTLVGALASALALVAEQLKWQARIGWNFSFAEARSFYPAMQDLPTFLARNLTQLKRSRAA
jgi:hypothetical protein